MKKITFIGGSVGYPVGENIASAIKSVKKMANCFNEVNEFKDKYVNIWCRGSSGAILATLLASTIDNKCHICHVKKDGEWAHNSEPTPARHLSLPTINVIIDDFICSGSTVRSIYEKMNSRREGIFPPIVDCFLIHGWSHIREGEVTAYVGFIPSVLITNV